MSKFIEIAHADLAKSLHEVLFEEQEQERKLSQLEAEVQQIENRLNALNSEQRIIRDTMARVRKWEAEA